MKRKRLAPYRWTACFRFTRWQRAATMCPDVTWDVGSEERYSKFSLFNELTCVSSIFTVSSWCLFVWRHYYKVLKFVSLKSNLYQGKRYIWRNKFDRLSHFILSPLVYLFVALLTLFIKQSWLLQVSFFILTL